MTHPVPNANPSRHCLRRNELIDRGLVPPGSALRLHLGCGEQLMAGYVNVDYPGEQHQVMSVRPDLEADITKIDFAPDEVDEIRLHHVFEHFSRVVALGLIIRWHRWLKFGGLLTIETPDFMATAAAALKATPPEAISLLRHLEGDQAGAWAYHVGQWYPSRFQHTLSALGFQEIKIETSDTSKYHRLPLYNVTAHARKGRSLSLPALRTIALKLLWESTVSDAELPTWEIWCLQLDDFLATDKMLPAGQPEHEPGNRAQTEAPNASDSEDRR